MSSTNYVDKEHIYEMEITNPLIRDLCPHFSDLHHDHHLLTTLNTLLPSLQLHTQALKGQLNQGQGGSFPIHSDSDYGTDSRHVSGVLYLNPNWKPGDGGELRLYPFPYQPIDIAPIGGRLVLFSSTGILHRVLPSFVQRYCSTIWFSGSGQRSVDVKPATLDLWELAFSARYRKHLARVILAEEWAQSLVESHPPSKELDQMLQQHLQNVSLTSKIFASILPEIQKFYPVSPEDSSFKGNWF
uniref:Fe2OG dioxygenase domain-containing protein n=1 Tax=Arcella intermedia TaxID=1963864 RepID=A0A6B2LF86_9EUKA